MWREKTNRAQARFLPSPPAPCRQGVRSQVAALGPANTRARPRASTSGASAPNMRNRLGATSPIRRSRRPGSCVGLIKLWPGLPLPGPPPVSPPKEPQCPEAHEADPSAPGDRFRTPRTPGSMARHLSLLRADWKRTVASQMADARLDHAQRGGLQVVKPGFPGRRQTRIDFAGFSPPMWKATTTLMPPSKARSAAAGPRCEAIRPGLPKEQVDCPRHQDPASRRNAAPLADVEGRHLKHTRDNKRRAWRSRTREKEATRRNTLARTHKQYRLGTPP